MKTHYKILTTIVFLCIVTVSALGNDGSYLTSGSVIFPRNETKVSLEKEILSFKVKDKVAYVDIQFVFNNSEPAERKLLIGFQAPTSAGDVSNEVANVNQIANFTIVQNGKIIPYQLKAAECEDCELKNPNELYFTQAEPGVFVYLFEITFKSGLNIINHSYHFPASSSVACDESYDYILKTGAKWAGGKIKNLTLDIDMGDNQYFYVLDIFGKKADWAIVGTGKVTDEKIDYTDGDFVRMVRILSGRLQIQVNDFTPTKNIEFGELKEWVNKDKFISKGDMAAFFEYDYTYTQEELNILRNTIYAQHNYDFKSAELKKYFSQCAWYMPNSNLQMEDIKLTKQEQKYIDEILKKEKKLKNQTK